MRLGMIEIDFLRYQSRKGGSALQLPPRMARERLVAPWLIKQLEEGT